MHKKQGLKHSRRVIILICVIVLLGGALYLLSWYANRASVEKTNRDLAELYNTTPAATEIGSAPSENIVETEAPVTPKPTTPETEAPVVTAIQTTLPSPTPLMETNMPEPTEKTVLPRFSALLNENPETVAFLKIGEIELPVVQKPYDNQYYLNHDFFGEESKEGTIFLDGLNRLQPEDQCLIVYGHNMKNDTMFASLSDLIYIDRFRTLALPSFDTLYEEQRYIPFAVVCASVSKHDPDYFDYRHFLFESDEEYASFIKRLRKRSLIQCDVDVNENDSLLLLVTCRYQTEEGRLIIALRRLRENESVEEMEAFIRDSHKNK